MRTLGLILTGGASRRMGRDKATLPVHGVPMALTVARAMESAGVDTIVAVGGLHDELEHEMGLRWTADQWPGEGPLGGIVSGLQAHTDPVDRIVVLACDLPFITADTVRQLIDEADAAGTGEDGSIGHDGERLQPLAVCVHASASATIIEAFDAGERSPMAVWSRLNLRVASPPWHLQWRDIDTPEELEAASRALLPLASNAMDEQEVPEIDIAEFAARRESGLTVLDVRELDEWQTARIPGVIHIPLTDLVERADEVPTDGELLVVCAKGGRSRNACLFLRPRGINATNVDGGTDGWIAAGHPVDSGS